MRRGVPTNCNHTGSSSARNKLDAHGIQHRPLALSVQLRDVFGMSFHNGHSCASEAFSLCDWGGQKINNMAELRTKFILQ